VTHKLIINSSNAGLAIVSKNQTEIRVSADQRGQDLENVKTKVAYEQLARGTNMRFALTNCSHGCPQEFSFTRNTPIMKSVPFVTFDRNVDLSFNKDGVYYMLDSQGFVNMMDFSNINNVTKVPALDPLKDY